MKTAWQLSSVAGSRRPVAGYEEEGLMESDSPRLPHAATNAGEREASLEQRRPRTRPAGRPRDHGRIRDRDRPQPGTTVTMRMWRSLRELDGTGQ